MLEGLAAGGAVGTLIGVPTGGGIASCCAMRTGADVAEYGKAGACWGVTVGAGTGMIIGGITGLVVSLPDCDVESAEAQLSD